MTLWPQAGSLLLALFRYPPKTPARAFPLRQALRRFNGCGALPALSIASLVTYPVLLALGVPPLSANMTNTVSLVLTGAGERGEECCFWDGECHGRCMLRVVR